MRFPPGPGGLGLFGTVFTDILAGLVFIILFVLAVGVLFVFVRFLWVATKAAELYIARNGSTHADTDSSEPVTKPVAPPPAADAATTQPTTTTTAAPSRSRTTKTPPAN
jgi:Na+-transporting methylmalonyl-CoA/oxaloacetate decarboxylase gamma subunit